MDAPCPLLAVVLCCMEDHFLFKDLAGIFFGIMRYLWRIPFIFSDLIPTYYKLEPDYVNSCIAYTDRSTEDGHFYLIQVILGVLNRYLQLVEKMVCLGLYRVFKKGNRDSNANSLETPIP